MLPFKHTISFAACIPVILITFFFSSIGIVYGQSSTGEISGKVVDADTGEELLGANVVMKPRGSEGGELVGTITDMSGKFHLTNVPLGQQTFEISYIGYSRTEVLINVQEGILATVVIKLQTNATQLDEVIIKGTADVRYSAIRNSTDLQLVNAIKFSEGVLAGISNEQIVKSADRDASQIVQRISGVSLVDRFVVVRGMDTRYNLTMVNGIIGPSSEDNSRAFSYDALPSGVIDRIELEKSPGPHLPAMWGGGVIKIYTRSFAKARQFNFDMAGGYRTGGSSFTDHFVTYDGSSKDWIAGGAINRRLPSILRQPYFTFPNYTQYPIENVALARTGLKPNTPQVVSQDVDKRLSMSYYDSWRIGKVILNSLTAASYTNERNFQKIHQWRNLENYRPAEGTGWSQVFSDSIQNSEGTWFYRKYPTLDAIDSVFTERIRVSGVQSLGVQFDDLNHMSATLFYNRFGTDRVTIRRGDEILSSGSGVVENDLTYYTYNYEQREIILGQLGGAHLLGKNSIDWTVGYAVTTNETPNLQQFLFQGDDKSARLLTGLDNEGNRSFQTFLVLETEERSLTGRLDYKYDLMGGAYVKAGGLYDRRERSFFSYRYLPQHVNATVPAGTYRSPAINEPWKVIDSVYSSQNFGTDAWYIYLPGGRTSSGSAGGAYFFDDEALEGYAAINYPFFNGKLTFYGGLRAARFSRTLYDNLNQPTLDSARLFGEYIKVPDRVRLYYLPSAMMKYGIKDGKIIIRTVYGQTIDRPQFREQAGASSVESGGSVSSFYDFKANENFIGNPGIENSLIHNIDLRVEYYPKSGEFVSIGGFYKHLDNPIQRIARSQLGSVVDILYENGKYAKIFGAEIEVRKKFDFLRVPVLRDMSVNFNASLIWSQSRVNLGNADSSDPNQAPDIDYRMQGTSPYLINAAFYYENMESGTLTSIIYNLTWDRLRDYSSDPNIGNLVEGRRGQLDFVFKQRITDFLTFKASVTNLLNQKQRFYRDQNDNYSYDKGINNAIPMDEQQRLWIGDSPEMEFRPGAYYTIGVNLTLQHNRKKE